MKEEVAIKDRFVEFLNVAEGIHYQTLAEDVQNRRGNRNYDYLLCGNGETLALEITRIPDEPLYLSYAKQVQLVRSEITSHISKNSLPGLFCLYIPYGYSMSINKLKSWLKVIAPNIAQSITNLASQLQRLGNEEDIQTELGCFTLVRCGDPPGLRIEVDSPMRFGTYGGDSHYVLSY